ncbi:amino acid permease 2 [Teratosphaeria nubilosa]|uniref:Amino acid permease 2 n=1 Tax=Teratosphaeria nubilosa TaxID=161662 RepID=A0A6G1LEV2_9PEZI|nr:amino acid permease 2 [Teratosphaeria nubilosa]
MGPDKIFEEAAGLSQIDIMRLRTNSSLEDARGMRRMGKEQQLVRKFRLISVTSFAAITTVCWEMGLFFISPALINGGRTGLIWSLVWTFVGFGPIYLSMAEMASMAPTCGAQYHWVSEFAPESCQQLLSFLTGWISTLAWQAGNAEGVWFIACLVQTLVTVGTDAQTPFTGWQTALVAIGCVMLAYLANIYGAMALPYWQVPVFAIHILAYFAYVIPIWVSAPVVTSHKDVWSDFRGRGGWSSAGLSVLVGQLTGVGIQAGLETGTHMAEEVKDSSVAVPWSILNVYVSNFCLILPAAITVCYHIEDLDTALADPTTYPAIYVLRAAMTRNWQLAMLSVIFFINFMSGINYLAAVTRDLFAFSRDHGLPFSKWLATIHPKRRVPKNACFTSCVIATVLCVANVASSVTLNSLTSLLVVALLHCYCFSIGCCLWRRIYHPGSLPTARFSLGRWGIPINALAVGFASWFFFWSTWPTFYPVTAANFNWSSVVFVGLGIFALAYFYIRGKDIYKGPVATVEGRGRRGCSRDETRL